MSLLADPAVDEALQLAASPVAVQATLAAVASQFQAADHIGWEGPARSLDVVAASDNVHWGIDAFFERRTPEWRRHRGL